MIDHPILSRKLKSLSTPPQIQCWIFRFFTGCKQAVISGGQQSQWHPITQSVVQGIGPSAYLVYSMDLKTLSPYNSILKYADDTSILIPQHSSVSMQEEFQNVQTWSAANKLQINLNKTKEIVFRRPSLQNFITPQPLPFIEQLTVTKFLGTYISATFSTTVHVEHTLAVANQRLYYYRFPQPRVDL